MIDILLQLANGFVHCLTPLNMSMLLVGIVIGLLIGVLPGLTLVMGVALALPFTYKMDVTASIVLLTAMYVSGTYGGAFTAILFRIPGEPIDVPMLWDGYTMGRKGKPAKALGWTLVAALGGGLLSAVVMVALTEPLARFALRFSSPEYFVIIMFGRHPDLDRRYGSDLRCLPIHLRLAHSRRRHRVSRGDGWGLWRGRGSDAPGIGLCHQTARQDFKCADRTADAQGAQ
jgi:hypothetical protein